MIFGKMTEPEKVRKDLFNKNASAKEGEPAENIERPKPPCPVDESTRIDGVRQFDYRPHTVQAWFSTLSYRNQTLKNFFVQSGKPQLASSVFHSTTEKVYRLFKVK